MTNSVARPTRQKPGLREALEAQGRKQGWLAEQLNPPVSEPTVSRWVHGRVPIPTERVREIAKLLGVRQRDIR